MKKTIMLRIWQCIAALLFTIPSWQAGLAQDKLEQPIPVDDKIRIGKLENGFTYYIRKNSKPENRVEMRLVVKAGSVLEDEDQLGLAHFVEHMAFNGTKNFAKNELVHYMQSVGVQFGPEVNAMTSLNETMYMLTLPTDSAHIVQQGFQIMEDWAHNITFDGVEIDKERGIIVEEWRINQGLSQRLMDKLYPALFEGSQYAGRLPIGKKEIIEGAPHSAIKRFYADWYRPDLMAFVVVGDIDPDETEKTIRDHFGALQNPANERPRKAFPVPDQQGTKVIVFSDKEMPVVQIALFCKTDPEKEVLQKDYRKSLVYQLVTGMLTQRLNELREQPDPPVMGAQVSYGSMVPEKSAFQLAAMVPEKGIEKGIQTLITESERAIRFGFTAGELTRQKKEFYSFIENAYNERDKTTSASLAAEYLRNFLTDEPLPGIEFEYNFAREYLDGITLEEVNEVLKTNITADNRLMFVLAPQKEDLQLPENEKVLNIITLASGSEITPYQDKITGSQLMSDKPKKGRILLTKKNEELGTVEMKLSNGAKVVLKPTDFKNDEVLFSAFSPGGYSVYGLADHQSAYFADDIVNECGFADYSPSDIGKLLAGKNVTVSPYISDYYEGVSGSATPRDLESMLQMTYLYFTSPRKDSAMFQSIMELQRDYYKNASSSPETYFEDQFTRAVTQNNPMADIIPSESDLAQVNISRLYEIYRDRFADVSDFTFILVGSFKVDSVKPLIESYLASLPSLKRQESWKDMGIRPPAKKTDKSVHKGNDPKSLLGIYFETATSYDPMEDHVFESLGQLLSIRYIDVIREEMSGAYTVRAACDLVKIPYPHMVLNIMIPCSPENTGEITKAAIGEIRKIQQEGVSPEDLVKVKEAQRRDLEKNLKENGYWLSRLTNVYRFDDPGLITQYADRINALTSEKLQEAAKKIDLKKYVRVVLYPEK
jgi:zinc protease